MIYTCKTFDNAHCRAYASACYDTLIFSVFLCLNGLRGFKLTQKECTTRQRYLVTSRDVWRTSSAERMLMRCNVWIFTFCFIFSWCKSKGIKYSFFFCFFTVHSHHLLQQQEWVNRNWRVTTANRSIASSHCFGENITCNAMLTDNNKKWRMLTSYFLLSLQKCPFCIFINNMVTIKTLLLVSCKGCLNSFHNLSSLSDKKPN